MQSKRSKTALDYSKIAGVLTLAAAFDFGGIGLLIGILPF
jgi:hypothetical protein